MRQLRREMRREMRRLRREMRRLRREMRRLRREMRQLRREMRRLRHGMRRLRREMCQLRREMRRLRRKMRRLRRECVDCIVNALIASLWNASIASEPQAYSGWPLTSHTDQTLTSDLITYSWLCKLGHTPHEYSSPLMNIQRHPSWIFITPHEYSAPPLMLHPLRDVTSRSKEVVWMYVVWMYVVCSMHVLDYLHSTTPENPIYTTVLYIMNWALETTMNSL